MKLKDTKTRECKDIEHLHLSGSDIVHDIHTIISILTRFSRLTSPDLEGLFKEDYPPKDPRCIHCLSGALRDECAH